MISALGIVACIGIAALGVDVAHLVGVKSELQKAADAGALAGARGLWPANLPVIGPTPPRQPECTNGQTWATSAVLQNQVDGANLTAAQVTVQVGQWNYLNKQFTAGCTSSANAVKVSTRKDDVVVLFVKLFGITSEDLTASAIAVMDFTQEVGKGSLPIALNKTFTTPGTEIAISLNPDVVDNGGWFVDPPDRPNATTLRDYIVNETCPPLHVGDLINLQNGTDNSVLSTLKSELELHPGGWDNFLPVVDTNRFNQNQPIVAFVPFRMTEVDEDAKCIKGVVLGLSEIAGALPGGPNYGALAPPKMVN